MKGDPFSDLEPLVQRVYAYLAYRLGDGAQAERVTARVFDRALRHRAALGAREDPAFFLVDLARRELAALQLRTVDFAERTAPTAEAGERYFELEPALDKLDESDRELIGLRYGAELSLEQMGALLDLRPDEVGSLLHEAVERLRKHTFVVA